MDGTVAPPVDQVLVSRKHYVHATVSLQSRRGSGEYGERERIQRRIWWSEGE